MSADRIFTPAFSPHSRYVLRDENEEEQFARDNGAPEAALITWAADLLEPHQTFVDVGAHVGTWAQHLATKCRRVHAFEPQQATYARLQEGIKHAELDAVVICHEVALGSRGAVDLHVVSQDGGGSTLRHRTELPAVLGTEKVRAAQLDDYVFDGLGLIKIDVEGLEMEVLRGAVKTLEEHRPKILFEAWTHEWYICERAELIGYVESLGYRVKPVADRPEMLYAEPVAQEVAVDLKVLLAEVETALPEGGDWCTMDKASGLIALILALRPKVVVELGVWQGGSAIPMAIALRYLGHGKLIAIDAWAPEASVSGQQGANVQWWGETVGVPGHEKAFQTFVGRLEKHKIRGARCAVRRQRTDEGDVPGSIDILHHDANHGPQALADIERWAPAVRVGGILVLDDLNWEGGNVEKARERAVEMGFVEMYRLGTGCVMQRVRI